jgi:hypothetical protein
MYLLNGGNVRRENLPRYLADTDTAALTTQVMTSVALPLQIGDLVSTLTWRSGGTAANTPTNQWSALYSPAGALLVQSPDLEDDAWAGDLEKAFTFAVPYRVPAAGVYFAALMVKATAAPSLAGHSVDHAEISDGLVAGQVNLAQTSGTGLTDTAPATIATPTAIATIPYVIAS